MPYHTWTDMKSATDQVSELCLGTMTFGTSERNSWGMPTCPERDCMQMLDRFYECGGNFIDTGARYPTGYECVAADVEVAVLLDARSQRVRNGRF
jgi:aryl-alcohol dehydrogenase-like predicted oxidoreductase